MKGHPLLFFRLASNAFPDVGSVGRMEKKRSKKKNHKKSQNRKPCWYPRMKLKVNIHIFGLTKCTIYCKKCSCFVPVFLYAVTKLMFQIKRIISREKWFNYIVTFFFEKIMPKIWVGRTTLNREKKEDSQRRSSPLWMQVLQLWKESGKKFRLVRVLNLLT